VAVVVVVVLVRLEIQVAQEVVVEVAHLPEVLVILRQPRHHKAIMAVVG
jgi:hypothetical protein